MRNSGFIIINKEIGPTSHNIISRLRKITGIKKIGHAGTLDPFASGVLVVAVSREATREIDKYVKKDKKYIATLYLGATTDTYDMEGVVVTKIQLSKSKIQEVENVLSGFTGEQEQIPPMYSAKKVGGKKLYELARKGIEIERKPSKINIYSIKLLDYEWPRLKIAVHCSSGTYIRSLANDIGEKLGCGAYLESLERTAVGDFGIRQAVSTNELNKDNWREFLVSDF